MQSANETGAITRAQLSILDGHVESVRARCFRDHFCIWNMRFRTRDRSHFPSQTDHAEAVPPICRDRHVQYPISATQRYQRLYFDPSHGQAIRNFPGGLGNLDKLFQPIETDFHGLGSAYRLGIERGADRMLRRDRSACRSELVKLREETHVVLEEEADVLDPELQHRDPFDAHAEGKTACVFGVVTH